MTEEAGLVERYARWRASPLGVITERVEERAVFDLAGPLDGRRVLDVGTGDGTYAIAAALRGAHVTGIDADTAMLAAARTRGHAAGVDVVLRDGRAESLPFHDATFDVVFAVTVLCFVQDTRAAVREIARVLAPGGRLVLGELGRFSVWAAERRVRGWLGADTWRRARFWSRHELAELVRDAGLVVRRVRGSVFFPPSATAARIVAPFDSALGRAHAPGAAFLVLAADKPTP